MIRIVWQGVLVGLLATTAMPVVAQEVPPQADERIDDQRERRDTITVVGRRDPYAGGQIAQDGRLGVLGNVDLLKTPFSVLNYTEDFKRNINAQSINDVLKYGASVYSNNLGANPRRDGAVVRGFGTSLGASLDGLPGLIGGLTFSIEPFEQFEVLLGPSALANGRAGNIGGSINYVPKRARDEAITRAQGSYLERDIFGASVDVGRRFGDDGKFGARANLGTRNGDGVVQTQGVEEYVASLGLDVRGTPLRVSLDFIYNDYAQRGAAPQFYFVDRPTLTALPRPPAGDGATHPEWMRFESDAAVVLGRVEYDFAPGWMITAGAGYNHFNNFTINYDPALVGSVGDLSPQFANQTRSREDALSAELLLRGTFATGPLNHQVVLGATHNNRTTRSSGFLDLVSDIAFYGTGNLLVPRVVPDPNVVKTTLPPFANARQQTRSLLIADTITAFDDRLTIIGGGRWVEIVNRNFNRATGAETSRYAASRISPTVGVSIAVAPNVQLYANYAEAFEAGQVVAPPALNAGDTLEPTVSTQYEAGVKVDAGGTIITLAAYDIDRAFIFRDPATNITGANGHQQHRGIEVTAFGSPVQGLRLFGSFSTFDPTLKRTAGGLQDGTEPVGLAKTLASANVDFDVPGVTGLAANFGAFYVGPSVINNANRIRLPGWARVDASLRYVFSVGDNEFRLQANVDNLLNKRAYQVDGGSYVKTLIRRTFSASLAVDF